MRSIKRSILNVLRVVYANTPLPGILVNRLKALYLSRKYSFNENRASKLRIYGSRRKASESCFLHARNRKKISDVFRSQSYTSGCLHTEEQLSLSENARDPDITIFKDFTEYTAVEEIRASTRKKRDDFESELISRNNKEFKFRGFCCACQSRREFKVDYFHAHEYNKFGDLVPHWRETLVCEKCGMRNRVRAVADLLYSQLAVSPDDVLYVTEQVTPFFSWLKYHFSNVNGSEYLGCDKVCGGLYGKLHHEDITQLSFPDNSLDVVLSFDVLEHVPDTGKALVEFVRCLKPGGYMLLSAPFVSGQYETIVRAKVDECGDVHHLLEPEYHGNPVSPADGSLCFYHFGWQLIDDIREAGARDAAVISYYSSDRANLGSEQLFILAMK